jgi:hypothetical protein
VGGGSYGQSFSYPDGLVSTALTETDLETGIQTVLAAAGYAPQPQDIFVVLLAAGNHSKRDTDKNWAGHHSYYPSSAGVVVWAVVDPNTTSQTEWRSTHEVIEATTNPDTQGWEPDIGDPCNGKTTRIAGLLVQQFWSEAACRCVREEDLGNVDIGHFGEFGFAPTFFRPSASTFFREFQSSADWQFGEGTDVPFTGDFDGDGTTEYALLRQGPPTQSRIINVTSGHYETYDFGSPGDVAVPGDYDNPPDGKTDLAMWQAALGWRYISSASGKKPAGTMWGEPGDIPVQADYDSDGITDFAVVRPSTGTWWVLLSSKPGVALEVPWLFTSGDIPVAGDYNGDGFADYAFWRPSTGTWYVSYSEVVSGEPTGKGSFAYSYPWGNPGDIPIGRDWDGDWATDLIVFRPSTGHWFTVLSSTGTSVDQGQWGRPGDVPLGQTSTFYGDN